MTTYQDERRQLLSSMLNASTLETNDIGFAAYLVTRGAQVTATKNGLALTGGTRCVWRLEHPTMRLLIQQYFETIPLCPAGLLRNRLRLKRGLRV